MADYIKDLRRQVGSRPLLLPGAAVILTDTKNRILLQLRADNGLWGLPGGLMELGETPEETAIREAYEETGLIVSELRLFGVYSGLGQYYQYPNGDEAYHVAIIYIAGEFEGNPCEDGDETLDVKFFEPGEIRLESVCPPDRPVLADYVKSRQINNSPNSPE